MLLSNKKVGPKLTFYCFLRYAFKFMCRGVFRKRKSGASHRKNAAAYRVYAVSATILPHAIYKKGAPLKAAGGLSGHADSKITQQCTSLAPPDKAKAAESSVQLISVYDELVNQFIVA